jgi:hypothetical protein
LFELLGVDVRGYWARASTAEQHVQAFEDARAQAKLRYRKLALQLHPDRGGDLEKFQQINAAWQVLQKLSMQVPDRPIRKSKLTVEEARGPAHTTVFVGVVTNMGTGATSTTDSQFYAQSVWHFTPGTGGF